VKYMMTLLPMLASLRRQTGLPHRIVIDEAHYFLHESNVKELLDLGLGAYTLVTYRASDLNPDVRKAMEIVCVTRTAAPEEAQAIAAMFGAGSADLSSILPTLKDGEATLLLPSPQLVTCPTHNENGCRTSL
jgi:DNA helicase HerA-like ATPase